MLAAARAAVFLVACAATSATCLAQMAPLSKPFTESAEVCTPGPPDFKVPAACAQPPRVQPYEPIYAIYQHTEHDENAFRLNYSLRYVAFRRDCLSEYRSKRANYSEAELQSGKEADLRNELTDCTKESLDRQNEAYLMFTGQFDFYMNTRPSGPVINRISNPGAHYRWYLPVKEGAYWHWVDIGVEHKSDGQTTDPYETAPNGDYRAQIEYLRGNHAYLDSISQDTNYAIVEAKLNLPEAGETDPDNSKIQVLARVKPFYFATDTAVTWGPLAAYNPKMSDYDRFRLQASYRVGSRSRIYADWTLGDKGLATDSFNFGLFRPIDIERWTIPLYFRAHYGPLHTLSDFTKKQKSFGVGLILLQ